MKEKVFVVKHFREGKGPLIWGEADIFPSDEKWENLGSAVIEALMAFEEVPPGSVEKSRYFMERLKTGYGFKSYGSFVKSVVFCLNVEYEDGTVKITPTVKDRYGFEGQGDRAKFCRADSREIGKLLKNICQGL